jgi:hypothetical protein
MRFREKQTRESFGILNIIDVPVRWGVVLKMVLRRHRDFEVALHLLPPFFNIIHLSHMATSMMKKQWKRKVTNVCE